MKWYYNMKIAAKFLTGFIIVAVIAGAIGVVGVLNMNTMQKNNDLLYNNMTQPISYASKLITSYEMSRIYARDMIMTSDPEVVKQKYASIQDLASGVTEYSEKFKATITDDQLQSAYDTFIASRTAYSDCLKNIYSLSLNNQDEAAIAYLQGDMYQAGNKEETALNNMIDLKLELAKQTADSIAATASKSTVMMIVLAVVGMLISIILGLFISRITSKPLQRVSKTAELISKGNFDVDLDFNETKDEIGDLVKSFRRMTSFLNEIMSNIGASSEQVAAGAKQVSQSSVVLSQGATEQASSIEELTASIEEIASQSKQNSEHGNEANVLAEETRANAESGNGQMKEMLKAMDDINESSANISKIIKVIEEIASQTNILALNAAVEAARAGQHGKGFAVVAEEVRNLAARSANAAKETTTMIEGSIQKVAGGTKIASQTADALGNIVKDITKVSSLINNIAEASQEQVAAIEQINKAVMQVSAVVQTNSSTAEEGAAASEELSSQAELLKDQLKRVKLKGKIQEHVSSYKTYEEAKPESYAETEDTPQRNRIASFDAGDKKRPRKIELSDAEFGKY